MRLGVLASGNGSNLQALIDTSRQPNCPYQVACVVANEPGAFALKRADDAKIPSHLISHREYASKDAFENAIVKTFRNHEVQLVALAGFMRIIGPTLLSAFENRIIGIHPALSPSFPGLHAVRQALKHGVKITGCTVYRVDGGTDSGPILAQAAVPVFALDDEKSLHGRIHEQEHLLFPKVIWALAAGQPLG